MRAGALGPSLVHHLFRKRKGPCYYGLMPRPYAETAPHMRAVILARLEQGETLADVCRPRDMPTERCVRNWAKKDAVFAAELAAAREAGAKRRGPLRAYPRYDERLAKAILARLAAGAAIPDALEAEGLSWRAFRHWRRTQAEFQEAVARLIAVGRHGRRRAGHGRWRAFEPAAALAILTRVGAGKALRPVLAADPALPCLAVVARWRAETPGFDEAMRVAMKRGRLARGSPLWSPALDAAVCERLLAGASLRAVAADPDMPCGTTLRNWRRRRPEFAHGVATACEMRDELIAEGLFMMAQAATPATAETTEAALTLARGRAGRMRRG